MRYWKPGSSDSQTTDSRHFFDFQGQINIAFLKCEILITEDLHMTQESNVIFGTRDLRKLLFRYDVWSLTARRSRSLGESDFDFGAWIGTGLEIRREKSISSIIWLFLFKFPTLAIRALLMKRTFSSHLQKTCYMMVLMIFLNSLSIQPRFQRMRGTLIPKNLSTFSWQK